MAKNRSPDQQYSFDVALNLLKPKNPKEPKNVAQRKKASQDIEDLIDAYNFPIDASDYKRANENLTRLADSVEEMAGALTNFHEIASAEIFEKPEEKGYIVVLDEEELIHYLELLLAEIRDAQYRLPPTQSGTPIQWHKRLFARHGIEIFEKWRPGLASPTSREFLDFLQHSATSAGGPKDENLKRAIKWAFENLRSEQSTGL